MLTNEQTASQTRTCSGIVQRVFQGGDWGHVKRDVDGTVTHVAVCNVHVDKWQHISSSSKTNFSEEGESPVVVGIEHRGSRQGQSLPRDDLPISRDSQKSSSIKESTSSESALSDDEVNDTKKGCRRKGNTVLYISCCHICNTIIVWHIQFLTHSVIKAYKSPAVLSEIRMWFKCTLHPRYFAQHCCTSLMVWNCYKYKSA